MVWDDKPDNGDKRRNPWKKQGENDDLPPSSWTPRPQKRGPNEPPDLDDLLKKAQANFRSVMPGDAHPARLIGIGLLALFALWTASGFYIVQPGDQAVVQRFGAWTRTDAAEGLHYHLPAPIETVSKVNVNQIRLMSIGYNEGASGRRDVPEESLMLTSDRNIVDLNLVIQWNVKNAEDYLFSVKDQENTIKKVAESAIREVVGQIDMFPAITNRRDEVASRTKEILQQNLDDYHSGINVSQILIQKAEVHPDVQAAFQDVQSARQDAQDVQNRAETYRQDILPRARGQAIQMAQEAEGYKQSVVAKATGDATRFNSIYEAYQNNQDVTKERIYLETMEDVLKNARKVIMDDKNGRGIVPYFPIDQAVKAAGGSEGPPQPAALSPLNPVNGGQQ